MSKAKQNAFLTGYLSILAVGTLGLGYLAWSSSGASTEAEETYNTTRKKLETLQKAPLFPNAANVAAKKAQVDAYAEKVRVLNNTLKAYQTPLEAAPDNSKFQSKLQATRDGIITEAKNAGVVLPELFDLGMGTYLTNFPQTAAVPRLTAWMEGMAFVTRTLIASGVLEITQLARPELPFEKKPPAAPEPAPKGKPAPKPAPKPAAGKGPKTEAPAPPALDESVVLERSPFSIGFITKSRALNEFLTTLANTSPSKNSPYFFNIRVLRIENEQKTGADTSKQVTVSETTDESGKPVKRDSEYLFGEEKLQVFLTIDLIRFPDPAAPAAPDAKK